MSLYGHEYGKFWSLCRSVEKTELKNLNQFKRYGQKEIKKIWPFPLFVWPKNDHYRVSTTNGSPKLIFMFSKSMEQGEWENTHIATYAIFCLGNMFFIRFFYFYYNRVIRQFLAILFEIIWGNSP